MNMNFPVPNIMIRLISVLIVMQITPITRTVRTSHQSRPIIYPRVLYEPCRNQPVGKFIKDRYACGRFFYCGANGLAISVECPDGMIFNDEKEICDFSTNYQCTPYKEEDDDHHLVVEPTVGTSVIPPIKPVTQDDRCPMNESGGLVFLANPYECHRYYICYHGYPIPQECIRELHWNPKMKRCDFPAKAGCLVTTTTPVSTSVAPGGVSIRCPFRGEQVFPHPEQCNYFIYCVNGYATLQQCPFFHHYDVESKSCMWQTMAKCIVGKDAQKTVKRQ